MRMKNEFDNRLYAVKYMSIEELVFNQIEIHDIMQEVIKLKKLSHPNIGKYYAFMYDEKKISIVAELVECDSIKSKIIDVNVTLTDKIKWFKQIASTLNYLHNMGIEHRNLTPANIFVTDDGNIKITNFRVPYRTGIKSNVGQVGCNIYDSYEKANDIPFDARNDIWALGCIMAELITGSTLKSRGGAIYLYTNPKANDRRLKLIEDCKTIHTHCGQIISKMLEGEQVYRCTTEQLMIALNNI